MVIFSGAGAAGGPCAAGLGPHPAAMEKIRDNTTNNKTYFLNIINFLLNLILMIFSTNSKKNLFSSNPFYY
jgi:hypothetical protein